MRWQGGGPLGASAFAPPPDISASDHPPVAWLPSVDAATLTIVRPVPWAQRLGDLRFRPDQWGDRLIRIAAPDGAALLLRRHGAPELALWLPAGLAPDPGGAFGLYLHPDRHHVDRMRAASQFRRAIGLGPPLRTASFAHAHRHAAMLYIHDRRADGASLRDIAAELLDPMPDDWRSSSERADLRRLAETASALVAGGYSSLLASSRGRS
jgi:hypothetical protein